jgi:hypothetical protein
MKIITDVALPHSTTSKGQVNEAVYKKHQELTNYMKLSTTQDATGC